MRLILFLFIVSSFALEYRKNDISLGAPNFNWVMQQNTALKKTHQISDDADLGRCLTSDLCKDRADWIPAVVPGTVMGTFLANGLIKNITDPFYEDNLLQFEDMSATDGRDYWTYWFSTNYTSTPVGTNDARTFLHLRGINYMAQVFLNSKNLSTLDSHAVEGQFQRHVFDLTPYLNVNHSQTLAILVYPVPYPGVPNGGQGGDHVIARNAATSQYVVGWDWVQATPDRNTGIWDSVSIMSTDDVILIQNPRIRTVGTGPTTLMVEVDLYNGGDATSSGRLSYAVQGEPTISQNIAFTVPSQQFVTLAFPNSVWASPKLWWPNGYGEAALYNITISATTEVVSDQVTIQFGVRDITWKIGGAWNNGYQFSFNGQPIFIRGGNWIATDQLLRFASNASVYDWHIRMHAEMGFNMIRVWGGGIAERPEFFDACDKYGIMVMSDFWMSGDCNGRWGGSYDWPDDHDLYLRCVKDTVYMVRNHPSLTIYTGGNELSPPGLNPPADISSQMSSWLNLNSTPEQSIDGTRPFILSTMAPDGVWYALAPGDGPYGARPWRDWFQVSPGLSTPQSFNPEGGSVMIPVIQSFQRFFSNATLNDFPTRTKPCDQNVNSIWNFHNYEGFCDSLNIDQVWIYGQPTTPEEFIENAQVSIYAQYRALFEGYTSHMWEYYTGMILWKSQGPWTDLRGHTYDWYGDQTAAFYGLQKALEPLHVQLNLEGTNSWRLCVVNFGFTAIPAVSVITQFYDYTGKSVQNLTIPGSNITANGRTLLAYLNWPSTLPTDQPTFLRLQLVNQDTPDTIESENFYWLSNPANKEGQNDFVLLRNLKQNLRDIQTNVSISTIDSYYRVEINLYSPNFVFFIHLGVFKTNQTDMNSLNVENRILPSWYSDNFFSILSGETKVIVIDVPNIGLEPKIRLTGWNAATKWLN